MKQQLLTCTESGAPPLMSCQIPLCGKTNLLQMLHSYFLKTNDWNTTQKPKVCVLRITCCSYEKDNGTSPLQAILNRLSFLMLNQDDRRTIIYGIDESFKQLPSMDADLLMDTLIHNITAIYGSDAKIVLMIDDLHLLYYPTCTNIHDTETTEFFIKHFIAKVDRCLVYTTCLPIDLHLGSPPMLIRMPICFNMNIIRKMWTWRGKDGPSVFPFCRIQVALCGGIPSLIKRYDGYSPRISFMQQLQNNPPSKPFMTKDLLRSIVNAFLTGHLQLPTSVNANGDSYENTHIACLIQSNAVVIPSHSGGDYQYRWPICHMKLIIEKWNNEAPYECVDIELRYTIISIYRILSMKLENLGGCPGTRKLGKDFEYLMTIGILLWLMSLCLNIGHDNSNPQCLYRNNFPLLDQSFHPTIVSSITLPYDNAHIYDECARIFILHTVKKSHVVYHFHHTQDVGRMHSYLAHLDDSGQVIIYGILCSLNPLSLDDLISVEDVAWLNRVYSVVARVGRDSSSVAINSSRIHCLSYDSLEMLMGFSLKPCCELYVTDDKDDIGDDPTRYIEMLFGKV